MKEKTLVVITYLPSEAQGQELLYAIKGWRRHFKEDYTIVLVGEGMPKELEAEDLVCIESKRVPKSEGQYRAHCDYVSCLKKVRAAFPNSKGFILVADDCYAVNDFTLEDVKITKALEADISFDPDSPNPWRRDKMKTRAALVAASKPTVNYTTHIPIWYEWDKAEALWERYDMEHESYVIEDLYYNIYNIGVPFFLDAQNDRYKLGIYTSTPDRGALRKALATKIWITNSPMGWVPDLVAILKEHFG